jgi:hypothetical protein
MTIQDTLNDRETIYGDFGKLAAAIQAFKNVYRSAPGWAKMTAVQREALDMDLVKTCRILYGDPAHVDSWADKCGYAMLAHEELIRPASVGAPAAPALGEPLDGPMPQFLMEPRT